MLGTVARQALATPQPKPAASRSSCFQIFKTHCSIAEPDFQESFLPRRRRVFFDELIVALNIVIG